MGLFKSLFGGKTDNSSEGKTERQLQNEFETLKYDGIRAHRLRRMDYARKCLEEAVKLKDDYETYGYLAQVLVEMGELEAAIEPLKHMAQAEPTIALNFISLANVYFMLEDYRQMEENAQLAIDAEPQNAQAYYLKGKAAHALNKDGEALTLLTQAVSLQEDYAEALLLRGEVYLRQGQLAEALQDADGVIASERETESGWLLRGAVHEVMEQAGEAEADYQQVLEQDPFNQQAYMSLGKLYGEQKRYADAISLMDDAIEMSPVFAESYALRAEMKELTGDAEGAAKDAASAANLQAAGEVKTEVIDPAVSIKEIDILHL